MIVSKNSDVFNEALVVLERIGHKNEKLAKYVELLLAYNEQINLTGSREVLDFVEKHVLDCILALDTFQKTQMTYKNAKNIVDVGSGGGLPGVVLAILLPESKVFLVERRTKKANFLQKIVDDLVKAEAISLGQITVVGKPFEQAKEMWRSIAKNNSALFWVRGFLPGAKLISYLAENFINDIESDLISPLILMKGPSWPHEKEGALQQTPSKKAFQASMKEWKNKFKDCVELPYELPRNLGKRILVIL